MTVNSKEIKVVVVGAGLAGLSCARELQVRGVSVRILERSNFPGGRCASSGGFDFGPVFLHGQAREFLELNALLPPGEVLEGWPHKIKGRGLPCQPKAFDPGVRRWALRSGMGLLTQTLAQDLDVTYGFQAERITFSEGSWTVTGKDGREERAPVLVLALALEQSLALLKTLPKGEGKTFGSPEALLGLFSTVPSLTLRVSWGPGELSSKPDWDILYPEDSEGLLLISRESSKRPSRYGGEDLVIQARSSWSASRLEQDKTQWAQELLDLARVYLGNFPPPREIRPHRWMFARLDPGQHLGKSWMSTPDQRGLLAMTGELFHPSGGLEGAFLAGRSLGVDLSGNPLFY